MKIRSLIFLLILLTNFFNDVNAEKSAKDVYDFCHVNRSKCDVVLKETYRNLNTNLHIYYLNNFFCIPYLPSFKQAKLGFFLLMNSTPAVKELPASTVMFFIYPQFNLCLNGDG